MRELFRYWTILILCALSACQGTYTHQLNFNPSEPLRVAVLPFTALDSQGKPHELEGRLLVDNISLVSSESLDSPTQILRKLTLAELERSGLDVLAAALIDIDLPHHGFGRDDGTLDLEKLYRTSPKDLCTNFLTCDAVMYGNVKKWDRTYLGLQSINTVALDLKLVSARDGKVLFETAAEDSDSRGLTKGPTGLSSLVLEPIKGLDSDIIAALARNLVAQMLEPLDVSKKPEYLASAPPAVMAVSHDAPSSGLSRKQPLVVVMFGTPASQASFSIGSTILNIPMVERSPGHYYGEYLPLASDRFSAAEVKVFLADKYGRTTQQKIARAAISLG